MATGAFVVPLRTGIIGILAVLCHWYGGVCCHPNHSSKDVEAYRWIVTLDGDCFHPPWPGIFKCGIFFNQLSGLNSHYYFSLEMATRGLAPHSII